MMPFSFHGVGQPTVPREYRDLSSMDAHSLRFRKLINSERTKCMSSCIPPPRSGPSSSALPSPLLSPSLPSPPLLSSPLTVCVRKRPISAQESGAALYDVLSVPRSITRGTGTQLVLHEPKLKYDLQTAVTNHTFHFDRVYSEDATTDELYKDLLAPAVARLDTGTQVTVFAYGQTGSGKSYTMTGMCAKALRDVFALISRDAGKKPGLAVCVSFYEIYCSKVFDLLADRNLLAIREDEGHAMQVVGLTEHSTYSYDVANSLVSKGLASRSSGVTKVNDESSRSHAVLQIMIRRKGDGKLVGKLSLVDLAGSEQAHEAAPPDKMTAHEGAEINKSLLALKECIRAMARGQRLTSGHTRSKSSGPKQARGVSGKGRGVSSGPSKRLPHNHIPFRGSKLTQVLRDCFTTPGAVTVMIATVSPSNTSADHSLNTLRYADRLKEVGKHSASSTDASVAATASSIAAVTAPLMDNSAGVRVGVLWNGGHEVWPKAQEDFSDADADAEAGPSLDSISKPTVYEPREEAWADLEKRSSAMAAQVPRKAAPSATSELPKPSQEVINTAASNSSHQQITLVDARRASTSRGRTAKPPAIMSSAEPAATSGIITAPIKVPSSHVSKPSIPVLSEREIDDVSQKPKVGRSIDELLLRPLAHQVDDPSKAEVLALIDAQINQLSALRSRMAEVKPQDSATTAARHTEVVHADILPADIPSPPPIRRSKGVISASGDIKRPHVLEKPAVKEHQQTPIEIPARAVAELSAAKESSTPPAVGPPIMKPAKPARKNIPLPVAIPEYKPTNYAVHSAPAATGSGKEKRGLRVILSSDPLAPSSISPVVVSPEEVEAVHLRHKSKARKSRSTKSRDKEKDMPLTALNSNVIAAHPPAVPTPPNNPYSGALAKLLAEVSSRDIYARKPLQKATAAGQRWKP